VTAEFDWWLLILGLVVGAGIVWLVLAELPRRDAELDAAELEMEAGWIAANLAGGAHQTDATAVRAVLGEHRAYLRLPPPDEQRARPAPAPADHSEPSAASAPAPDLPASPATAPSETGGVPTATAPKEAHEPDEDPARF
jgi:hypothetical protein